MAMYSCEIEYIAATFPDLGMYLVMWNSQDKPTETDSKDDFCSR